MEEKHATIFSNQPGISVQVCPRGHVYLSVGHPCLALHKDDFLDLAQGVRATEHHLRENPFFGPSEPRH